MYDIYKYLIATESEDENQERLGYAAWLCDQLPRSEFVNEDLVMYSFIEYCVALGVPVKEEYLSIWLDTELREVLKETNAKVKGTETLDFRDPVAFETGVQVTKNLMEDNFKVLKSYECHARDFVVEAAAFFTRMRSEKLTQALSKTYDIINETNSSINAAEYALRVINTINEIYSEEALAKLKNTKGGAEAQLQFVTDCGIPVIDQDSLGLYTTQLFDIEAQPGTGKTRMAIGTYGYRACTIYHKNVLFITLEQSEAEIEAMAVARHTFELYHIYVSDKQILTNTVPDECKKQVEAARFDLFESGKYGKFKVISTDLFVETIDTKLQSLDSLYGPFDLIIIDYVGLIGSKPGKYEKAKTESECIKEGLRKIKHFVRTTRKAGLTVSQFNQAGIDAGKADKEITPDMAQGGLGVYRHTDYNIAMSMTNTMRLQQKRRISNPKVRSSSGYEPVILDTRLAFCYFKQTIQKAV